MNSLQLRGRKQQDPTYSLAPALRDSFHESVRAGDIERLRHMLEQEPLLSRARTRERETPLLLASVHPDAHKAVEMIDLLMEKEAVLGSRDRRKRNALLYACHHGVEWVVVECLMKWNASMGGGVLKWSHCDESVHSSLLLACLGGHTQLALRLLDEIDMEKYEMQNHPFHVLQAALELGDEAHALAIAEHPKIQSAVRDKGAGGILDKHTLRRCVGAAVEREMATVLGFLDSLNHPEVSKSTWRSTLRLSAAQEMVQPVTTNPVILGIADQFERDQRWEKVKGLFLLRSRGQEVGIVPGQLRADLLGLLPDQPFRLIVEFTTQKELHRPDAESAFEAFMQLFLQ
jgi:hypothetical protein